MTVVEKAAYLKGLAEGTGCMSDKSSGKVWENLCELLSDLAHEVEDLQLNTIDLAEALNDITETVNELDERTADLDFDYWDDDDEDDEGDDDFAELLEDDEWTELLEDDESDDADEELVYDGIIYDAVCPNCGEEIDFTEQTLAEGFMLCPGCGEKLEFDLDDEEDEPEL